MNPKAAEYKPTSLQVGVSSSNSFTPYDTIESHLKESDAAAIAKLGNNNITSSISVGAVGSNSTEAESTESGEKQPISLSSSTTMSKEEKAKRRQARFGGK